MDRQGRGGGNPHPDTAPLCHHGGMPPTGPPQPPRADTVVVRDDNAASGDNAVPPDHAASVDAVAPNALPVDNAVPDNGGVPDNGARPAPPQDKEPGLRERLQAYGFVRDPDHELIAGVTAGIGRRLGVDPLVVRIALVILTLAGGAGLILYAIAWIMSRDPEPGEVVPAHEFDLRQTLAVALITLGLTLLLRSLGIWFSDALVWPALVAGTVSATIWMRAGPDDADGPRLTVFRLSAGRIIIAALILFAGVVTFWAVVPNPRRVVIPLAGIIIGGMLLAAPLLARLWQRLEQERATTARQQARDEVAAHLHDSVLQTLTLIQRSDDPRRATTLARTQERELRAWLYGARDLGATSRDLEAAVDDLLTEVETNHELDVDAVVVGHVDDVDHDEHVMALLAAVREALVNVARHAQVNAASLYVEVDDERITAFVRDRGVGFDPSTVPADRHGLRDSIHGRLRRHAGGATVFTTPGEGTEVEAWIRHRGGHHDDTSPNADADPADPADSDTDRADSDADPTGRATTRPGHATRSPDTPPPPPHEPDTP